MAKIQIVRDSGFADRSRDYEVICDGELLGKIANGDTGEFEVSPGKHEIYLSIDWCRSNSVSIDVAEGHPNTMLKCGSNLGGLKLLLAALYITVWRNDYIWLTLN
ncbi:hypothetical protein [Planctobacterium marinum]|uniref:Uncharacterized protein n=1 Tax=Planctobacterium marinum TaxID=1631968 RepID=A0AA48KS95_9ALTE|nr:hypothetical protein MACH26_24230 [Planctobacterium marinum]